MGRWIQPDSVVPDKGNPQGLDRYAYVANNPVTQTDVSGHCWGIASGIRGLPSYGTTCDNLDKALTIVQSEQTTLDQKVLAGSYIAAEGTAHAALVAGTAMLACSAYAPCVKTAGTILGIGEAACADGDCETEVRPALEAVSNSTRQIIPKLTQGNSKMGLEHIARDHWFSSGKPTDSHFLQAIGVKNIKGFVSQAAGDINLWNNEGNSFVRIIDIGKEIGFDKANKVTSWLKVVVNITGEVITTYPVSAPPPTN